MSATRTKNIHHRVTVNAAPKEIYRFFTDAKLHAKVTEKSAKISKKIGGAFETCDGNNVGYNLALEPGKRIVQAWSHQDFPNGDYTVVDIKLKPKKGGTEIEFNQTGVPSSCHGWLDSGWYYAYWDQLNKFYPKKGK